MENPTLSTIYTELIKINGNLEKHVELTKERLDRHYQLLLSHGKEIYGEGENDPGLKNHMTRILLIQNAMLWVLGVVSTGVIGLIINTVWTVFHTLPK